MPDDHAFERSEVQSEMTGLSVSTPSPNLAGLSTSENATHQGFDPGEGWYLLIFLAGLTGWGLLALITWMSIN